jgi:glutamate/tyrosine decarboxylase-like PLP-dependent enzyme
VTRFETDSLDILRRALDQLGAGFPGLPAGGSAPIDGAALEAVLVEVANRLRDNFPYFHPQYVGQMLKPPHEVARLAYALTMWINPNNHALDGGRASSAMEREAVAALARMVGWGEHLGHLTGGGTIANLEALWVAGRLRPGATILASAEAHYTHHRMCGVLGIPFETVASDRKGRMDLGALERRMVSGEVGTVVATMGTTAAGAVDPLGGILDLARSHAVRVHADAAYGGYFTLADNLAPEARGAFDRLSEVDSIVIDPHKHGLQPYGAGCVLFRDPGVGQLYRHDSPYTYFSSGDLHLGEISLECSRAGAAAVALWATQRLLPMEPGGVFAEGLARGRSAALDLHARLKADPRFLTGFPPELDIVVWIPRRPSASEASRRSRRLFDAAARHHLHLALAELPCRFFPMEETGMAADRSTVTALRSVVMKAEHADWMDRIWEILDLAAQEVDEGG